MDLPVWAALYADYGAYSVSMALAALGYAGVPEDDAEAELAAMAVRAYLEGA